MYVKNTPNQIGYRTVAHKSDFDSLDQTKHECKLYSDWLLIRLPFNKDIHCALETLTLQ